MKLFFARLYEVGNEGVMDLAGDLCLMLTEVEVRKLFGISVVTPENKWAQADVGCVIPEDSESDFFARPYGHLFSGNRTFWTNELLTPLEKLEISMGWVKLETINREVFVTAPDIDQAMWDFLKQCQREGSKRE